MQYQYILDLYSRQQADSFPSTIQRHPTPAIDPRANWKTYTNQRLGFQFNYPEKSYQLASDDEPQYSKRYNSGIPKSFTEYMGYQPPKVTSALRVIQVFPTGVTSVGDTAFAIWIFDNPENLTIEQWYAKYWYYPFKYGKAMELVIEKNKPNQPLVIDKLQGKSTIQDSKGKVQYAYVALDKKMLLFKIRINSIGDQILSSFRFLDSGTSPSPIEGSFCGGIAGIICPTGYSCNYDGNYPDAGGKCVKKRSFILLILFEFLTFFRRISLVTPDAP